MKRLLGFAVVGLIFAAVHLAASDPPPDFRQVRWGMTPTQVKASEKIKPDGENADGIVYPVQIAGLDASLFYRFVQSTLVDAHYGFLVRHTNGGAYLDDFDGVKKLLTEKYGKPVLDDQVWENDLYKDDPQNWGTALAVGHLHCRARWETPTTIISEVIWGDNFEIHFAVMYQGKAFLTLAAAADKDKDKDGL
jgi:hypothetical protein